MFEFSMVGPESQIPAVIRALAVIKGDPLRGGLTVVSVVLGVGGGETMRLCSSDLFRCQSCARLWPWSQQLTWEVTGPQVLGGRGLVWGSGLQVAAASPEAVAWV